MIRCSKCGTINKADASFCSECNAYLEWSGEKVDVDEPQEAPPEPVPAAPEPVPRASKPPAASTDMGRPPEQPAPSAPQPESRKPERAAVSPRPKPKATPPPVVERPKPGDLICGQCGIGNDPQRKFCRRCGTSLVAATIEPEPPRPPWYKRIFRRGSGPAAYEAGDRPEDIGRQRRRPGCLLIVVVTLLIVIIAAGLAYAFHDGTRSAVDGTIRNARCRIMEQIDEPTQASIAVPARGAYGYDAFDNSDETTWRATRTNDQGAFTLEVRLDKPGFVHRLEITPAEDEPRPDIVRIHDAGDVIAREELDNSGDIQAIAICRDLARFHLRIVTTYPEGAAAAGIRRIVVKVKP